MSTSGTYAFNPGLGEIVLYAYQNIGLRPTSLVQEHFVSARMASNMMLARWSNEGVNLWAVDLQTVPLVAGQATYNVPLNTVTMLDTYITIDNGGGQPIDRIILSVSRTEYASYPNKEQEGFPTTFWFDRLINPNPTVTLWPVPDGSSAQYLKYYRVRQLQDSNLTNNQGVEIPYLWMEAFADGLTYRLARIWNPQLAVALKGQADESYNIAAQQNIETAQQYISPQIMGYYRP